MTGSLQSLRIGIFALQGAFAEHECCLRRAFQTLCCDNTPLGGELNVIRVRRPTDISGLDGLIIPGGESTTMAKFLAKGDFVKSLTDWSKGADGCCKPVVWGTCAGLILLANNVRGKKTGGQITLGGLSITTDRNTYGRQVESFEADVTINADELRIENGNGFCPAVFIRAPGIASLDSPNVRVLATVTTEYGERPVAVEENNILATSFHPELTEDLRWHRYFLRRVLNSSRSQIVINGS